MIIVSNETLAYSFARENLIFQILIDFGHADRFYRFTPIEPIFEENYHFSSKNCFFFSAKYRAGFL